MRWGLCGTSVPAGADAAPGGKDKEGREEESGYGGGLPGPGVRGKGVEARGGGGQLPVTTISKDLPLRLLMLCRERGTWVGNLVVHLDLAPGPLLA